jgi:hypothetical protein
MVDYFEEKLTQHMDRIYKIRRGEIKSTEDGQQYKVYIIQAEEGLIDPKYEIPPDENEDI